MNTIIVEGKYDDKLSSKENHNNFVKNFSYDNNYPIIYNIKIYKNDGKYIGEFDISDDKYYTYGYQNHIKIMNCR